MNEALGPTVEIIVRDVRRLLAAVAALRLTAGPWRPLRACDYASLTRSSTHPATSNMGSSSHKINISSPRVQAMSHVAELEASRNDPWMTFPCKASRVFCGVSCMHRVDDTVLFDELCSAAS